MHYVYLIRSEVDSSRTYVGLTNDAAARLAKHNEGGSRHTANWKPWQLATYVAFSSLPRAREFERYLKFGSGRAFANKRLW